MHAWRSLHVCVCHAVQDIRQLFKDHVPYIVADEFSLDMAQALGATCNTSADTVLQVLTAWSAAAAAAASQQSSSSSPQAAAAAEKTAGATAEAAADDNAARDARPSSAADADAGSFTTTLHDMGQLYHHLSRFLVNTQLPSGGFSVLQDKNRLGQLAPGVVVRLQVSKAFNDAPLIWLPDTDDLLRAAAAYRAAESQRSYMMDDDGGGGFMGRPQAAAAAIAACSTGYGSQLAATNSSSIGSRRGGARSKFGRAAAAAGRQGTAHSNTQQASAADPVADDAMYDAALISSLAHTPLRGRFYSPDQLRFTDDTRVLEVTYPVLHVHYSSSSSAAAAGGDVSAETAAAIRTKSEGRPPPMLRVVGVYYGAQQQLFVEQLQRFKYDNWIPLVGECLRLEGRGAGWHDCLAFSCG